MKTNERLQRVIALLNRADVDYLDNLGKDSLFTKGTKLSRIKIIRAMVEAMKELDITGIDIGSEKDLKEEILKKVSSYAAGLMDKGKQVLPRMKGGK